MVSFNFLLKENNCDTIVLLQVQQLRRAASLPPVEQAGMVAAINYSIQSRLSFDTCWLENIGERIVVETVGNKITPLVLNPGRVLLTNERLYFQVLFKISYPLHPSLLAAVQQCGSGACDQDKAFLSHCSLSPTIFAQTASELFSLTVAKSPMIAFCSGS